jgi:hypothetical protein
LLNNAVLRKKKKEKFKDLESYKRKLKIDKLKLMPLEPREHLKRVRESLEIRKEKNSNTNKRY